VAARKAEAGREPWDAIVMVEAIVLCELDDLSDDQVAYQLRARLSVVRFLGLGLEDTVAQDGVAPPRAAGAGRRHRAGVR
jgi:IS5 family transposase